MVYRRFFSLFLGCLLFATASLAGESQPLKTYLEARKAGRAVILKALEPGESVELIKLGIGDTSSEDISYAALAHTFFMRRHFEKAAFLYSTNIDLNPDHFESYNNLAALLVELNAADSAVFGPDVLEWAVASARFAVANMPDDGFAHNTVSRALQVKHAADGKGDVSPEALDAAEKAITLDPDEPLLWANLARLRRAAGDKPASESALENARIAGPNDPGYWVAANDFGLDPDPVPEPDPEQKTGASQCTFSFNCSTQCLSALSTGALIVSCEIEQMTQITLCQEGKPFQTNYDCKADKFLSAGQDRSPDIKLCSPNYCFSLTFEGNGKVAIKTEGKQSFGPLDAVIAVEGKYSPSNGFSFVKFAPEARFNLLAAVPAANKLGKWGVSTSHTAGKNGKPGKLEIGTEAFSTAMIGI